MVFEKKREKIRKKNKGERMKVEDKKNKIFRIF